jgi:glycosyltransferase involved in cell wall biosynthesis
MLALALGSVARQTVLPDEVIVVDNSPAPAPIGGARLTALGIHFRVVPAPLARNASAVRNIGLRHASSDVIAFLDDDDAWLPTKMEKQLKLLKSSPKHCAVVCGRLVVSHESGFVEIPNVSDVANLLPYDNFGGSFSFIVYDRSRCTGLTLDEGLDAFQDWDFLLRAARFGPIGVVPEVLAVYNEHRSPRITRRIAGRRRALCVLLGRHRRHLKRDARRWMISRQWDLRAQEAVSRGDWHSARHGVWRSLQWGWRCQFPLWLKCRSLARRLVLLLPRGPASRVSSAAIRVKGWASPHRPQRSSA